MGANTKPEKVRKSISGPDQINPLASFVSLPISLHTTNARYLCTCCGKEYEGQKGNFSKSRSPIFKGNNGYIPVCNNCRDRIFVYYTDLFSGNEEKAIERVCQLWDWFYEEDAVVASMKSDVDRSRISAYTSKINLRQTLSKGQTYSDTLLLRSQNNSKLRYDDTTDFGNDVEDETLRALKKTWGCGFDEEDYYILNEHFETFAENVIIDGDMVVLNLIKELCMIHLQKMKALRNNNIELYDKLVKTYQSTLNTAELKPNSKANKNSDVIAGKIIEEIEKYSPAEVFTDQNLYKDFDGIKEMLERDFLRPLRNTFTGSNEHDPEFYIPIGDE